MCVVKTLFLQSIPENVRICILYQKVNNDCLWVLEIFLLSYIF